MAKAKLGQITPRECRRVSGGLVASIELASRSVRAPRPLAAGNRISAPDQSHADHGSRRHASAWLLTMRARAKSDGLIPRRLPGRANARPMTGSAPSRGIAALAGPYAIALPLAGRGRMALLHYPAEGDCPRIGERRMIVKATNLRGPHGAIDRAHRFAKLVADPQRAAAHRTRSLRANGSAQSAAR
jgi:hypothetical protein